VPSPPRKQGSPRTITVNVRRGLHKTALVWCSRSCRGRPLLGGQLCVRSRAKLSRTPWRSPASRPHPRVRLQRVPIHGCQRPYAKVNSPMWQQPPLPDSSVQGGQVYYYVVYGGGFRWQRKFAFGSGFGCHSYPLVFQPGRDSSSRFLWVVIRKIPGWKSIHEGLRIEQWLATKGWSGWAKHSKVFPIRLGGCVYHFAHSYSVQVT